MGRFFRRGVSKFLWLPTILDAGLRPTWAELVAAVVLEGGAGLDGWSPIEGSVVDDRLCGAGHGGRRGRAVLTESSMTFWADRMGADTRLTLTAGAAGNVAILDGGLISGAPMDVFQVDVGIRQQPRDLSSAATITVPFAIRRWVLDQPVPVEA